MTQLDDVLSDCPYLRTQYDFALRQTSLPKTEDGKPILRISFTEKDLRVLDVDSMDDSDFIYAFQALLYWLQRDRYQHRTMLCRVIYDGLFTGKASWRLPYLLELGQFLAMPDFYDFIYTAAAKSLSSSLVPLLFVSDVDHLLHDMLVIYHTLFLPAYFQMYLQQFEKGNLLVTVLYELLFYIKSTPCPYFTLGRIGLANYPSSECVKTNDGALHAVMVDRLIRRNRHLYRDSHRLRAYSEKPTLSDYIALDWIHGYLLPVLLPTSTKEHDEDLTVADMMTDIINETEYPSLSVFQAESLRFIDHYWDLLPFQVHLPTMIHKEKVYTVIGTHRVERLQEDRELLTQKTGLPWHELTFTFLPLLDQEDAQPLTEFVTLTFVFDNEEQPSLLHSVLVHFLWEEATGRYVQDGENTDVQSLENLHNKDHTLNFIRQRFLNVFMDSPGRSRLYYYIQNAEKTNQLFLDSLRQYVKE
jgi:hypothetical protein